MDEIAWEHSSLCAANSCVEVARLGTSVLVRDGKHPDVAPQEYTRDEWLAFIEGVKRGEFDLTDE